MKDLKKLRAEWVHQSSLDRCRNMKSCCTVDKLMTLLEASSQQGFAIDIDETTLAAAVTNEAWFARCIQLFDKPEQLLPVETLIDNYHLAQFTVNSPAWQSKDSHAWMCEQQRTAPQAQDDLPVVIERSVVQDPQLDLDRHIHPVAACLTVRPEPIHANICYKSALHRGLWLVFVLTLAFLTPSVISEPEHHRFTIPANHLFEDFNANSSHQMSDYALTRPVEELRRRPMMSRRFSNQEDNVNVQAARMDGPIFGRRWFFSKSSQDSQKPISENRREMDRQEQGGDAELGGAFDRMQQHGMFGRQQDATSYHESSDFDSPTYVPLVYQYYGRNRSRPYTAGSVPFIMLGPSAGHWRIAAKELAAKGFSVIACERAKDDPALLESSAPPGVVEFTSTIVALMEALRWNHAVLVACDAEAVLAVQAAVQLAPEKIAGLVLCGNLHGVEEFVRKYSSQGPMKDGYIVDQFLRHHMPCPFSVVWDGDKSTGEDAPVEEALHLDDLGSNRCLVLGGGSAPHRRRPELFAWVLTRFVEEKIAPPTRVPRISPRGGEGIRNEDKEDVSDHFHLPFGLGKIIPPESWVVIGRLTATTLLYAISLRVGFYQFENLRSGIFDFQSKLQSIWNAPIKFGCTVLGYIKVGLGYLFGRDGEDQPESESEDEITKSTDKDNPELEIETLSDDEEGTGNNENNDDGSGESREHTIPRPIFLLDHVIA